MPPDGVPLRLLKVLLTLLLPSRAGDRDRNLVALWRILRI